MVSGKPMDRTNPRLCVALFDSLSIRQGRLYEWSEYEPDYYARYNENPPRIPEGTLTGIGGAPPTCICVPVSAVRFVDLEPPGYFDWL